MLPEEPIKYEELQSRITAIITKEGRKVVAAERIEKISEEVVEFYEALYNQENDFGYLEDETVEEAADIVITLMAFMDNYGVDILREVDAKLTKVESGTREPRGWRKKIHIRKQNVENGVRLTITALKA